MIPLTAFVSSLVEIYGWFVFAYVLLSWFPNKSGIIADIDRFLATLCEPYIGLFRRILPSSMAGGSGLDFSPLVALLVLQIIIRPVLVSLVGSLGL